MSKNTEDRREREQDLVQIIGYLAQDFRYKPPELWPHMLWSLYGRLEQHFATSNAQAELSHVAAMLRKIGERCREDREFRGALKDALAHLDTGPLGVTLDGDHPKA